MPTPRKATPSDQALVDRAPYALDLAKVICPKGPDKLVEDVAVVLMGLLVHVPDSRLHERGASVVRELRETLTAAA